MSKSTTPIPQRLRARGVLPVEAGDGYDAPRDPLFGLDRAFMRTRTDTPKSGRAAPKGREGGRAAEAKGGRGELQEFLRARGVEAPEALVAACLGAIEARTPLVVEGEGEAAVAQAVAAWAGLAAQIEEEAAEPPEATDAWWLTRAHAARFARKKVPLADALVRRLGLGGAGPFPIAIRFNDARFQGVIRGKEGARVLHLGADLAEEMAALLDADDGLALEVDARDPSAPVLAIDPYVGELRTVVRFVRPPRRG